MHSLYTEEALIVSLYGTNIWFEIERLNTVLSTNLKGGEGGGALGSCAPLPVMAASSLRLKMGDQVTLIGVNGWLVHEELVLLLHFGSYINERERI